MLFESIPFIIGVAIVIMLASTLRTRAKDSQGKYLGLVIVIIAMGVLLIVSSYNGILNRPLKLVGIYDGDSPATKTYTPLAPVAHEEIQIEESDEFYGIMFDAGSTGSRIHAFRFKKAEKDKPFEFLNELFKFNSVGLSSFAENPKEGAESLIGMLDEAKQFIPESKWASTPIGLKATAGLRLLPGEKADALLDEVRVLFGKYPFKASADSVSIMEGNDEGIFSWFTVNFLKGVLGDVPRMSGVMDLGGGSTQITFTPLQEETLTAAPADYLLRQEMFGTKFKLYTHSYLGLGLMAGRLATLGEKDLDHGSEDQEKSKKIDSVCLAKGLSGKMHYGSKDYTIEGKGTAGTNRFEECYALTKKTVSDANIPKVKEIAKKKFYTISYYYDRAVDAGLIHEDTGGEISVQAFYTAAEKECATSNPDSTKKPLLCLDLCYISALLHEGFGFEKDTQLTLKKKIDSTEISWALGAMFDYYNKHKQ